MGEDVGKSLLTYGPLGAFVIVLCGAVTVLWTQINKIWTARIDDYTKALDIIGKASATMAVVSEVSKAAQADTERVAQAMQAQTAGIVAVEKAIERLQERQDEQFARVEAMLQSAERSR